MTIYEVKLVPKSEPNADGRWVIVESERLKFGQEVGDEFIVSFKREQPFYQWGGHSKPDIIL